eukprot:m.164194 g.164194  ORF g.164194 m.164194 type:complete len:52 (+) comp16403_c1_seq1:62-217(+)
MPQGGKNIYQSFDIKEKKHGCANQSHAKEIMIHTAIHQRAKNTQKADSSMH